MSASVLSTNYSAQLLATTKGPGRGVAAPTAAANLRILSDSASIPVGAPSVETTQYIRFMKVPKGAIIYPHLVRLSTTHTAAIPGKLVLVPVDGTGSNQEITSCVAQIEALAVAASGNSETLSVEPNSVPDAVADVVVAEDSWVQFVPTSDLTIASTAKTLFLRLPYGQTY